MVPPSISQTPDRIEVLASALSQLAVHKPKTVACEIIAEFGTIAGFGHASEDRLRRALRQNPAAARALIASREILVAGMYESVVRSPLDAASPQFHQYLFYKLRHLRREVMLGFFADGEGLLLGQETLAQGETGSVRVSARHILRRAIHYDARGMVLVHNHPSGGSEPSVEDLYETDRIRALGVSLDVILQDHLVVARDGIFSIKAGKPCR